MGFCFNLKVSVFCLDVLKGLDVFANLHRFSPSRVVPAIQTTGVVVLMGAGDLLFRVLFQAQSTANFGNHILVFLGIQVRVLIEVVQGLVKLGRGLGIANPA